MTVRDEDIRQRLQLGEDSRWEFKQVQFAGSRPTSPARDDLADEMIAFANANGGLLLLGVTDDGLLQGMSREQMAALGNLMVETGTDSIEPALRIDVHNRELDGKAFVVVEVPRGDSLHERGGRSWIRVDASKRRLTGDERMCLAQRRAQARYLWFDRQAVPSAVGIPTLPTPRGEPMTAGLQLRPALQPAEGAVHPGATIAIGELDGMRNCNRWRRARRREELQDRWSRPSPPRGRYGFSGPRSGPRTVRTGHGARRTTSAATLPSSSCPTAPRPRVPITISSARCSPA